MGGTVAPGRAARHTEPPPGRRRWWLYVLVPLGVLALAVGVAFTVSRLVEGLPETDSATTLPTATRAERVETVTALQTSTSQLPSTSRLPTSTAPPTTAPPTTQAQPAQVQVPDVVGRRARVARATGSAGGRARGEPAAGPRSATAGRPAG